MFTFWLEIFLTTDAQIKGPIYGLPDEMKNILAYEEQCLDSPVGSSSVLKTDGVERNYLEGKRDHRW